MSKQLKAALPVFLILALLLGSCTSRARTPTSSAGAQPTSVPASTATPRAILTPEAGVDTGTEIDLEEIVLQYLEDIAEGLGPRESATEQEATAAKFIAGELGNMGYQVTTQPFEVVRYSREEPFLTIVLPVNQVLEANFLSLSGTGVVSEPVVSVGRGTAQEFPGGGLEGKVALVQRGTLTFEQKVQNAQNAGASAVIIFNNEPGNFFGTLASPSNIPALSISQDDGNALIGMLQQGDVVVDVKLTTYVANTRNVAGVKSGRGTNAIVIGAHYDTVPDVSGANDNASGTAVLLTLASLLKDEDLPFDLRFIAFGSEEIGLLGSLNYLRSIQSFGFGNIKAMLNFDAIGSGGLILTGGDTDLVNGALSLGAGLRTGIAREFMPRGTASDHVPFANAGVPVIYFSGNDFRRIHTPEDTLEHINPDMLRDAVDLGMAVVMMLAEELGGNGE